MIGRYEQMRARTLAAGGPDKVAAQHQKGKLTARERIRAEGPAPTLRRLGYAADAHPAPRVALG